MKQFLLRTGLAVVLVGQAGDLWADSAGDDRQPAPVKLASQFEAFWELLSGHIMAVVERKSQAGTQEVPVIRRQRSFDGNLWALKLNYEQDGLGGDFSPPSDDLHVGQDMVLALNRLHDGIPDRDRSQLLDSLAPSARRSSSESSAAQPAKTANLVSRGFFTDPSHGFHRKSFDPSEPVAAAPTRQLATSSGEERRLIATLSSLHVQEDPRAWDIFQFLLQKLLEARRAAGEFVPLTSSRDSATPISASSEVSESAVVTEPEISVPHSSAEKTQTMDEAAATRPPFVDSEGPFGLGMIAREQPDVPFPIAAPVPIRVLPSMGL